MNKLTIVLVAFSATPLMSGCASEEQHSARCEAKGTSRDVCHHEEKEYWDNYSVNMSRPQAANTQADAFKEAMSGHKEHKYHDDDQYLRTRTYGLECLCF